MCRFQRNMLERLETLHPRGPTRSGSITRSVGITRARRLYMYTVSAPSLSSVVPGWCRSSLHGTETTW